jgi:hypothetical protein
MADAQTPQDPQASQKEQEEKAKIERAAEATKQKIHQDFTAAQKLATTADMQDIVVDIEKELLTAIMQHLEDKTMTAEAAQTLAKEFIAFLPIQDKHDLLHKLQKLSDDNREAQGVYLKFAKPYEEEDRLNKLQLMSEHIKNGAIEDAIAVAKGGHNTNA